MKTSDLILLGAVAVGGYFVYKTFFKPVNDTQEAVTDIFKTGQSGAVEVAKTGINAYVEGQKTGANVVGGAVGVFSGIADEITKNLFPKTTTTPEKVYNVAPPTQAQIKQTKAVLMGTAGTPQQQIAKAFGLPTSAINPAVNINPTIKSYVKPSVVIQQSNAGVGSIKQAIASGALPKSTPTIKATTSAQKVFCKTYGLNC